MVLVAVKAGIAGAVYVTDFHRLHLEPNRTYHLVCIYLQDISGILTLQGQMALR